MSWTKRELINEAYDAAGLSSYVFNLQSEDYQSALRKLDAMMASWHVKGIDLAYPTVSSPSDSDLDTPTNIPDFAVESIYSNLAMRIAPSFGKAIPAALRNNAVTSYNNLMIVFGHPRERPLPSTLPRGSGNRPRLVSNRFFPAPQTVLQPWDKP